MRPPGESAWLAGAGGERWPLQEETLIGRKAGNDVRLADPEVSRYHALIRAVGDRYVLSDLGSANGTYVADRTLLAPHALRSGERLRFGQTELVFWNAAAEAAFVAPAGPAPIIEQHTTPHFLLHYPADSEAARHLVAIEERLERFYAAAASFIGFEEASTGAPDPIDVHLADWPGDPRQTAAPPSGRDRAVDYAAIHAVYRADAPGETLEQDLAGHLLARAAGRPGTWPPGLVAGLHLSVSRRVGSGPPVDQARAALAEARAAGQLPALATLLTGPAPGAEPTESAGEEGIGPLAVADFIEYLDGLHGSGPLRRFLAQLGPDSPDTAARSAYGAPLRALERRWHKTLRSTQGGIARFLRLTLRHLRPQWPRVAEIVVYMALTVAFAIGMAQMQGLLLDRALIPGDLRALATIMGVLVAAFAVVTLASLRESYLVAFVSESVLRDLRLRAFANVQRLHPGYFQRTSTGDILSRMTGDLAAIEYGLTGALAQGLQMLLILVAALGAILLADWRLALLVLAGLPLFFVTGRFLGPAAAAASAARQGHLAEMTSKIQENLGAQPVVKAFGLEGRSVRDFTATLATLFRSSLRLTFLAGLFGLSASALASAIQLSVLGVGAWLVIRGNLTAGMLFTFLALVGQIIGPVQNLSAILEVLQQASGAMDRVQELLEAEPEIRDAPGARPLSPSARNIRFEGVSFGYDEAQPVLRDLNLTIPAGASVGLVGPSGCGKSTILNLLLRFHEPQAGRVTVGGVDLREATLASLRAQIGVVAQDTILFDTSIRENIRLGRPEATDAEVAAAARAAELHDLVLSLPEGYDSRVGERGNRLSGGQRQRVALARAIIRDPPILLLDEATSALDPQTEAAIGATLSRLAESRTTISVTHRLASVARADRIFVFDGGRLVEQGTHDELVRRGGLYARLWQEQYGAIANDAATRLRARAARLQRAPLFANLAPDLLDALAERLAIERFGPGEVIIRAGEVGDTLYIIDRGQVEVLAPQSDGTGEGRSLAMLGEGDYFGEIALLRDLPRSATVRARTAVELYSLISSDFRGLLAADPALRDALERTLAARQQAAGQQPVQVS